MEIKEAIINPDLKKYMISLEQEKKENNKILGIIKDERERGMTILPEHLEFEKEQIDKLKIILGEIYEDMKKILKEYCDLKESYYSLITIWIIGTYLHDNFETYPYLYINAMKGSGKTRLLKLIKTLSKNGDLLTSLKESVLFRTAKGKTLCIDEFESIGSKENQALRELLNACYKKGMKVKRMKKVKIFTGEDYQVEEFEPYTPICMANIWGIEEVLGDRSITMVLERSSNPYFNLIMEDFDSKIEIKDVKARLDTNLVSLCRYFSEKGYIYRWNNYIKLRYNDTNTYTTYTTVTTLSTQLEEATTLFFFNKIHDTGINGRNLELFLPLFLIANFLSEEVFKEILEIGNFITKERKEDEMIESKDMSLFGFIASKGIQKEFISIKKLTNEFRQFLGDDDSDEKWINGKWVGRALKRLSLIKEKRRVGEGREVILNVSKAIEKTKTFGK